MEKIIDNQVEMISLCLKTDSISEAISMLQVCHELWTKNERAESYQFWKKEIQLAIEETEYDPLSLEKESHLLQFGLLPD